MLVSGGKVPTLRKNGEKKRRKERCRKEGAPTERGESVPSAQLISEGGIEERKEGQ